VSRVRDYRPAPYRLIVGKASGNAPAAGGGSAGAGRGGNNLAGVVLRWWWRPTAVWPGAGGGGDDLAGVAVSMGSAVVVVESEEALYVSSSPCPKREHSLSENRP
jgi:hypothetical protein